MKKSLLLTIVFLLFICGTQAQTKVENFALPNAIDNKIVKLNDFASQALVVIVFTSNYCPFSKLYEDRLIDIAKKFENQGVKFLFINANTSVDNIDDSVEEMKKQAATKKYPFPYLSDKTQQVAKNLGATRNPEVFVLQANNGSFQVRYRGAIDNNPQVANEVTEFYLRDVIVALLNRKNPSMSEKKPVGCMIKKE
jgi:peroxiredoxin